MKRPWAVIFTAAVLVGCRSSQPATNPFLRTTVPPPATGQAVVVAPGEPYTPGIPAQPIPQMAPQAVAPVAPAYTTPPPMTPMVNPAPVVAPAPVMAPPIATPPPAVAPPRDPRYVPPGGTFQYNQSSLDRSKSSGPADEELDQNLAQTEPSESGAEANRVRPVASRGGESGRVTRASYQEPVDDRSQEVMDAAESEPGESLADADRRSDDPVEPQEDRSAWQTAGRNPVIRITANDTERTNAGSVETSFREVRRNSSKAREGASSAIVTSDTVADTTEAEVEPAAPSTTMPTPANRTNSAGADYAFDPDYGQLRGRLEYSQSSRQWKLRYIPIDGTTDRYGGSVVLPNSPALASFKPGDVVAVRGSLASQSAVAGSFSPRYQLEQIEPALR